MEFSGKIKDISRDFATGQLNITFMVSETGTIDELLKIKDCEKLAVKAVKYRNKRSIDANAYAWVLMQKIAESIHSDKWSVYLNLLQKYSRSFTHVIVKSNAVDVMKELYRTCIDLGEVNINGQSGHQLQVYFGSSTFDSKEMSVFIDGIISECEELGIDTKTPDEIKHMCMLWQAETKK